MRARLTLLIRMRPVVEGRNVFDVALSLSVVIANAVTDLSAMVLKSASKKQHASALRTCIVARNANEGDIWPQFASVKLLTLVLSPVTFVGACSK